MKPVKDRIKNQIWQDVSLFSRNQIGDQLKNQILSQLDQVRNLSRWQHQIHNNIHFQIIYGTT